MATPDAVDARLKAADKLDQLARRSWQLSILTIPAFLFAASDLATRWEGLPRRLDVGIMLAMLFGAVGPLTLRSLARRARSGETSKTTRWQVVRAVVSSVASLVFVGFLGYLIQSWMLAVLLPAGSGVLTLWSVVRLYRRRRHSRLGQSAG